MHRQAMRSLLMSGALTAALALAGGAARPAPRSLADALVKAYQTSPVLQSNRAALRSQNEAVPQARGNLRPQVDLNLQANTQSTIEDIADQLNQTQAALNVTLTLFDNGQTKAAVESARNTVAAGRADLTSVEQTVLFNAVQAYVDVRRGQEFVRLGQNDVERLNETLDATKNRFEVGEVTRTDVSQSKSRLAASRSQLSDAQGALETRARPISPPSAPCRSTCSCRRRCRSSPRHSRTRLRSASSAIRRSSRRSSASGRPSTTSTGRWPPRARPSASAPRAASSAASSSSGGPTRQHLRPGRHRAPRRTAGRVRSRRR